MSRLTLSLLTFLLVMASPAQAGFTYVTPTGSTTSGGSVNAEADFTINNGSVTIALTNYLKNPKSIAQLISGLTFDITGASAGPGSLSTVNSGLISTINAGGSYTAGVSDPLTRWTATKTGININLTTMSGGTPDRLIIGPDSAGGFNSGGTFGDYANANPSITGIHNPSVLGTAYFTITTPGVTSTSTLSNVIFQFGTTPGIDTVKGQFVAPAPNAALLVLAGVPMLCLFGWLRQWSSPTPEIVIS